MNTSLETTKASRRKFPFWTNRLDLFTTALLSLAYLLMLAEPVTRFGERGGLALLGALYLAVATLKFARVQRLNRLPVALAYLGVAFALAALLMSLGGVGIGSTLLLLLALSQGARVVPLPWALAFCALLPFMHLGMSWPDMLREGSGLAAAGVFVVLITRVAVNERRSRAEQEALAAELGEANRRLGAYALQVEELSAARERNRIAREIHDGLGHHLTAVHVQLQAAHAVLRRDPEKAKGALEKARGLTQEALADVRLSVSALRAPSRPLGEALAALAREAPSAGVPTTLSSVGTPRRLEPPLEGSLYRVAQEGLTNVRKHARATNARLTLAYEPRAVELTVCDDGVGAADPSGGFGLLGIRERVQALGGEVQLSTAPRRGLTLRVRVPA